MSDEPKKVMLDVDGDDVEITLREDRKSFKCPGCRIEVSDRTPKCPFELGGACDRHPIVEAITAHFADKKEG